MVEVECRTLAGDSWIVVLEEPTELRVGTLRAGIERRIAGPAGMLFAQGRHLARDDEMLPLPDDGRLTVHVAPCARSDSPPTYEAVGRPTSPDDFGRLTISQLGSSLGSMSSLSLSPSIVSLSSLTANSMTATEPVLGTMDSLSRDAVNEQQPTSPPPEQLPIISPPASPHALTPDWTLPCSPDSTANPPTPPPRSRPPASTKVLVGSQRASPWRQQALVLSACVVAAAMSLAICGEHHNQATLTSHGLSHGPQAQHNRTLRSRRVSRIDGWPTHRPPASTSGATQLTLSGSGRTPLLLHFAFLHHIRDYDTLVVDGKGKLSQQHLRLPAPPSDLAHGARSTDSCFPTAAQLAGLTSRQHSPSELAAGWQAAAQKHAHRVADETARVWAQWKPSELRRLIASSTASAVSAVVSAAAATLSAALALARPVGRRLVRLLAVLARQALPRRLCKQLDRQLQEHAPALLASQELGCD